MDNYSIPDQARASWVDKARRQEVERERRAPASGHVRHDGVPSVVPTRAARTHIELGAQHVDELALALIAPLRAEHDRHCSPVKRRQRKASQMQWQDRAPPLMLGVRWSVRLIGRDGDVL
jgi:hypothetical protein